MPGGTGLGLSLEGNGSHRGVSGRVGGLEGRPNRRANPNLGTSSEALCPDACGRAMSSPPVSLGIRHTLGAAPSWCWDSWENHGSRRASRLHVCASCSARDEGPCGAKPCHRLGMGLEA